MLNARILTFTLTGLILVLNGCSVPAGKITTRAEPVSAVQNTPLASPAPAAFVTSDLRLQTAECNLGADMGVTVTVTNVGGQTGNYSVVLKVNGVNSRVQNVTLDAGASGDVYFVLSQTTDMPEFYTYKISVDGLEQYVGVT